jgi:hypothetical protein
VDSYSLKQKLNGPWSDHCRCDQMEDPGVVANTHLQAYLVLPTKDNSRKKETAVHVILGRKKKLGVNSNCFHALQHPFHN